MIHGKPSEVRHDGAGLYAGLPDPFEVGRYHSLAVEQESLPSCLLETAWTDDDGEILMGVRHADRPHVGVQCHPESILTDAGKQIIENFCSVAVR
ncbi:anthranilate synthase component II [Natrinema versiforme JCM 10478]|uniref:anthranilate synthase n=1 Tax=Natrinema versiforme JCM 10478 TaxID=1227496 RepID=L9XQN6_9EURY|nr:anthranilate synthase component II [Natrinema versiforme JCM 10478]